MSAHQIHGMGVETTAPDWPVLRGEEVELLLQKLQPALSVRAIRWHSPRPFSAAAEVDTDGGTVFVKRHHRTLRDARTLGEEHRFITHLHQHGAAVAQLLHSAQGHTALQVGEWTYEVQCAAAGEDHYREAISWTRFLNDAHAHAAGRALAELHRAATGYHAPARSTTLLVANFALFGQPDPIAALADDLQRRPALATWLQSRDWRADLHAHVMPWHSQAWPWLRQAPPPLWTHGDWHGSNLLWQGDGTHTRVSAMFDFGLADRSFALYDLATAIERNLIPWLELDDGRRAVAELDQLDALLHGYSRVLPLDGRQLQQLAVLLPVVHADFALSEIEYFAGITRSAQNAGIAYDRYLLGHVDWFANADGQHLLHHLRRRARAAAA
jgi:Ser/Thr protein kinase RdoA (MazF antagonist)